MLYFKHILFLYLHSGVSYLFWLITYFPAIYTGSAYPAIEIGPLIA